MAVDSPASSSLNRSRVLGSRIGSEPPAASGAQTVTTRSRPVVIRESTRSASVAENTPGLAVGGSSGTGVDRVVRDTTAGSGITRSIGSRIGAGASTSPVRSNAIASVRPESPTVRPFESRSGIGTRIGASTTDRAPASSHTGTATATPATAPLADGSAPEPAISSRTGESIVDRLATQRDARRETLAERVDARRADAAENRDARLGTLNERREERTAERDARVDALQQRIAERRTPDNVSTSATTVATSDSSTRSVSVVDRLAAQREARRDALNGNRQDRLNALDERREERAFDRDTRVGALRDRIEARRDPSALSEDTKPSRSIVRDISRSTTYDTVTTPDGVKYIRRDVRDISYSREVIGRRMDRSFERNVHIERERLLWVKDRPHDVRHTYHSHYTYFDGYGHARHWSVWPSFRFVVSYNHGCYNPYFWSYPGWSFRYVYPYYHRKYVFVSLGGYWPMDYAYQRYYWYGCHPYEWYGYYPVPYEVGGDTYNYYTYNYYGDTDTAAYSAGGTNTIQPADHTTFADVREKLAQQAPAEPATVTAADMYFEAAVKAFEAGDFATAAAQFAEARIASPEDTVLPFAYAQALFAQGRYVESAEVLREALVNVQPDKEGVFYPRGLYKDDEPLIEQIEALQTQIEKYPFDANLQLLMGYHLLGIGETEAAVEPLQNASLDLRNTHSATVLLNLAAKLLEARQAQAQPQGEAVQP